MDFVFAPLSKIKFHDGIKTLGIATFSKFKIIESSFMLYRGSSKTIPVIYRTEPEKMNRGILKTFVQKDSQTFCLVNNYFTWSPEGNPNLAQRADLKKLLKLLSQIPGFVMCGDFNAPRGREIFDKLAKVYKDNIPKDVTTTIDKNFHYAGDLQLVVDGLFTTKGYRVKGVKVINGVSDHCAIIGATYNII